MADRGGQRTAKQKKNMIMLATAIMLVLIFLVGFSHATVVACLNLYAQMYVVKGEANQPNKYNIGGGPFVVNGSVLEGR